MCMQYAVVEYYNVKFYIIFKRDEDISKFWYLSNRIEAGEQLYMLICILKFPYPQSKLEE